MRPPRGRAPRQRVVTFEARDGALVLLGDDSVSPSPGRVGAFAVVPNCLPLSARAVRGIASRIADLPVERIYGSFGQRTRQGGARAIAESAERYAEWVSGVHDDRVGHD